MKLSYLIDKINKALTLLATSGFTGKMLIEINISQGGITICKVTEEKRLE